MTELGFGMIGNVLLQLIPAIMIIPYFFAVHADRNNTLQQFNLGQSILKFPEVRGKRILQTIYAAPDCYPRPKFSNIERLADKIVGPTVQGRYRRILVTATGKNDGIIQLGGLPFP